MQRESAECKGISRNGDMRGVVLGNSFARIRGLSITFSCGMLHPIHLKKKRKEKSMNLPTDLYLSETVSGIIMGTTTVDNLKFLSIKRS